jgi:hypothetical protein
MVGAAGDFDAMALGEVAVRDAELSVEVSEGRLGPVLQERHGASA